MTNLVVQDITTSSGTWPSEITLHGNSYAMRCGKLVQVHLNMKINSAEIKALTIENIIPAGFRPRYDSQAVFGDGRTDGVGQPVTISSTGNISLWPSMTGVTYAQGDFTYIQYG